MLPDFPEITEVEDFTTWASLMSSVTAFTGDQNLQESLVVDPTTITVGEYLSLLDQSEASLSANDFTFLNEILPTVEQQLRAAFDSTTTPDGTTVDEFVNTVLGFLQDLAAGNFSFITDIFDQIRNALEGVPLDTPLFDGFIGGGDGGSGGSDFDLTDFFGLPGLPDLSNFGWIAGDPHLQTLDGVGYDFQAAGEYVLLQSAGSGNFMLQARMVPVGDNVSVNQAIATNLNGTAVMIDANDATPLHIAGQAVSLNSGQSVTAGNGRVYRDGDSYIIAYPGADGQVNDGDSQVLARVQDGRLDLDVRLNAELMGTLEGLLGDGDGNAANDIALADGSVLSRPLAFDDLYGAYRDDWRVDSLGESLFTYDTGESLEGFYDAAFPGELISLDTLDPSVRTAAETAAQAAGLEPGTAQYNNAVLDFALTDDQSFITSALQTPLSLIGTPQADNLTGNTGADVINGRDGNDTIAARGGNDIITGGGGNDILNGGADVDTAVYSGAQNGHTLTLSATSTTLADRRADGDGTDTLIDIETLKFNDKSFDLTQFGGTTGLSADAFESFIELYIAYFNRAPDAVGLNYWGTAYANGATLEQLAGSFLNQQETLELYPENSSNSIFLENVYNNVLGRQSDPDGFQFWLDNLDSGALQRDTFILNLLGGAQGSDVDFLETKVDIGTYFSVIKGLSDGTKGAEVMALFDGTEDSIQQAITKSDEFYQDALDPTNGEFLLQVVGVLDDPFAIA